MTNALKKERDPRIRFAPDILRRLGEELNPSLSEGILELAKNAYDANATQFTVRLRETDAAGGEVFITDNGDGMTRADILSGWLVVGKSSKESVTRTRLGRVPAGNKGLGRLAALRLGRQASLTTRPLSEPNFTHQITIDWQQFDDAEVVEDVLLEIHSTTKGRTSKHGTELVLKGLREKVGRHEAKRLARALILLANPFNDDPRGFKPVLEAPEFSDLEELVKGRYFADADYHLVANLDESGQASARVLDWRGDILFEASHKQISVKKQHPSYAGPVATFELWAYILRKSSFVGRSATIGEVREWLGEFGGVHLYEGDLRVAPYGNPGNDWLDMNLARSKSPEERPSTNTSIGRVQIAAESQALVQKTDRSGYIETDSFRALRAFCQDALSWMQRERLAIAEKRRAKNRVEASKKSARQRKKITEALQRVPPAARKEVEAAVQRYERVRDREVSQLQSEVQLYRTLSTAGITAAVFAHEAEGNPLKAVKSALSTLRRRSGQLPDETQVRFMGPLEKISRALEALQVLSRTTLGLVQRDKRRVGRVQLHDVVARVLETLAPFFSARRVRVTTELADGTPYLRASEAAVESILTNLLNNALTALATGTQDRRILIRTTFAGEGELALSVLDSGPGIVDVSPKSIWLPGETTQPDGTGLGLTIVRDTARDLGGDASVIPNGELGGAEFRIKIPIIGA